MTHSLVELAVATLSAIVILQLWPQVRALIRAPATRWMTIALIALIAGGLVGDMQGIRNYPAFKLVYGAAFIVLTVASLLGPKPEGPKGSIKPLVAIIALWGWLFVVNAVQNSTATSASELLIRLAPGLIWIALLLVWARSPITRQMLASAAGVSVAIPGLIVPIVSDPWRSCDIFKCGVFDAMLVGNYTSENYISQQVTIIGVLSLVAFGLRRSVPMLLLAALWLLAGESRTSQITLIVSVGVAVSILVGRRLIARNAEMGVLRGVVVTLAPAAAITVAMWMAMSAQPTDFSNRGSIWIRATAALTGSEWSGLGIDRWSHLQSLGLLPTHFPHSLYVLVYFSGGIIGLVVLYIWLRQCLRSMALADRTLMPAAAIGSAFMTLGLLEVVWNPLALDGTSWIPIALMAVPLGRSLPATGRTPQTLQATRVVNARKGDRQS